MRRHALDPVSLVAGLVFSAVAIAYLVEAHTDINIDGRWVLPLALIGLGIAGVLGALGSAARQRHSPAATATPDTTATPVSEAGTDEPAAQSE
jgi:hypothetical protein